MLLNSPSWSRGMKNQYMAAISGSMAYSVMGAATAWPSPTLLEMAAHTAPLTLDYYQISWMVSLMFIGHISSPVPSGYLMDRFGRKRTCLSMATLPFTSWMLTLYATCAAHLYIARFLAGLWIGVITTIVPLYVGEVAEPKLRSSLTTLNNLFLNFGVLYVYVIGPFVSYSALAIFCEMLTVIFFCIFLIMPESPYYLIKQQNKQNAFEVLCWLRQGEPLENIDAEIKRIEQSIEEQKMQKGTLKNIIFDSTNRKAIIISIGYAVLKRLTGSGVMQAFASITLPQTTFNILSPNICVIIIGIISLVSCIFSTGLAIKFRRRTLLTISCGGCGITTAIVSIWFYLNNFPSTPVTSNSDIIFISIALYYCFFNIGLGPTGTSIKGELFATNVKALSSSITTLAVATAGFFVNKYYLIIAESMGMYVNYLIFSVSCFMAVMFTWLFVPVTDNKSLEEVHQILKGNSNNNYQRHVNPVSEC